MNIQLKEIPHKLIRVYAVTGEFPIIQGNVLTLTLHSHIITQYGKEEVVVSCISPSGTWNIGTSLLLMALDNCGDEFIRIIQMAVDDEAHAIVGDTYLQPEEFEKLVMNTNGVYILPRI